jgi:hypothetical protein
VNTEVSCRATLAIPLPPHQAIRLFTPEGERAWVEGWEPVYAVPKPAGARGDGDRPGTVFTTHRDGEATIWIVLEREQDGATLRTRYARTAVNRTAGVVTVTCRRGVTAATSIVGIGYDLSPLSDEGAAHLREFARSYDKAIAGWSAAIQGARAAGRLA